MRPRRPSDGPASCSIAIRSGGDNGPVVVADVNLKFIWDVVSRIKIGEKGKAYVVDGNGFLIADPDIGLVLRKTNLSQLPHVKAALAGTRSDELAMVSTDLGGTEVLTSVAPIDSLRWSVFVEQPVAEVNEKRDESIERTGLLLSKQAASRLPPGQLDQYRSAINEFFAIEYWRRAAQT